MVAISHTIHSGVATLGPTGALAPPSASVAPPQYFDLSHARCTQLYIYIYFINQLQIPLHPLVSLVVGL